MSEAAPKYFLVGHQDRTEHWLDFRYFSFSFHLCFFLKPFKSLSCQILPKSLKGECPILKKKYRNRIWNFSEEFFFFSKNFFFYFLQQKKSKIIFGFLTLPSEKIEQVTPLNPKSFDSGEKVNEETTKHVMTTFNKKSH